MSSDPGLVSDRPRVCQRTRSSARRWSMVAADIRASWWRVASVMWSSPQAVRRSTIWGRNGARRFPSGASSIDQTFRRASITSGP
ncbi:hypothetical protein [Solihabitans fulvus]|uniref:hypothetical protein n=1 Tax=Solihabitans fulvus TaxID=1892852 RepID=UPI0016620127|nr:hypothetical protein [Solihabitans fulvus]